MSFIFLILSLFLFLFILYILVKHDFVLARKSLLLQEIFDSTFVAFLAFLISGRIFYILGEQKFNYLKIVNFFHLLKFPGVLFIGGIAGFYLVVYIIFRKKKILARIFDIYSLSLYPVFIYFLFSSSTNKTFLIFEFLIFFLSCIFLSIGIYSYKNYTLRDGSVTYLFICLTAVFTIVSEFTQSNRIIYSFFTIPQVISFCVFLFFAILLLMNEGVLDL